MTIHIALSNESLFTNVTNKWFLTRMYHNMPVQTLLYRKSLFTNVTFFFYFLYQFNTGVMGLYLRPMVTTD